MEKNEIIDKIAFQNKEKTKHRLQNEHKITTKELQMYVCTIFDVNSLTCYIVSNKIYRCQAVWFYV